MEISNLLSKLTRQTKTKEKEYFLAVEIWEKGLKSAIWTVEDSKTKAVALGSEEIWEETVDDLVAAADKSLSVASERFVGENGEPSKVVFGLPYSWLEKEKIVPKRQKNASRSL